jgi:4-hydroxymandelate oxidase
MRHTETRRRALRNLAMFVAGSPLVKAQQDPLRDHSRVRGLFELETTFDFEPVAYAKITRSAYDYTSYGADGEFTLRRNREAYDWVELIPSAVSVKPQMNTTLFGQAMDYPLLIAPTAFQGQLHPEAEAATHRAAAKASNTPMVVSGNATLPFEKVTAAAASPVWIQLYPRQDLNADKDILQKAQDAGARAVVVTVDQQASVYERQLHDRNLTAQQLAPGLGARLAASPANPYRIPQGRLWYDWKLFDQLRSFVKVPMLAKGILTGEDAQLCLEHGLDGIYVSNHGGRSLDYGPSTLEVLPEIVDAVRGRVPVIFDSGIRRGADAVKALALGASAVGLGRTIRWGLAAYGADGVQKVLEIMQAEMRQAMAYTGSTNLASLDRSRVKADFR